MFLTTPTEGGSEPNLQHCHAGREEIVFLQVHCEANHMQRQTNIKDEVKEQKRARSVAIRRRYRPGM